MANYKDLRLEAINNLEDFNRDDGDSHGYTKEQKQNMLDKVEFDAVKAHASLACRIADLEKAIIDRRENLRNYIASGDTIVTSSLWSCEKDIRDFEAQIKFLKELSLELFGK